MSIHQPDSFYHTSDANGSITTKRRIQQGVKGLVTSAITHKGDISFYFEDAFISRINAGKGKCKISFRYNNRDYMFHGNFSVTSGDKGRKIEFNSIKITDMFDETIEYNIEHFNSLYTQIESQIQIFLFMNVIQ